MFLVSLFISSEARAVTNIFIRTDLGGGNGYNWVMNGFTRCIGGDCNDCVILVLGMSSANLTEVVGYGYNLTVNINELQYENTVTNQTENSTNTAGFTFNSDATVTIIESTEFPELNNKSFSLANVTLGSGGQLQLFIPNIL